MKTLNFNSALVIAMAIGLISVAQEPKKVVSLTGSTPITTGTQFPGWMLDTQFKPEPRVLNVKVEADTIVIEYARDYYPSAIPAVYCNPPCDWTIHERWRDVYGVKNGKLALLKTITGTYVPAKTEAERVIWETADTAPSK